MTKYVLALDAAVRLAQDQTVLDDRHQLLAPALLRSQVLSLLYGAGQRGELSKADDALVTQDTELADAVRPLVAVVGLDALA